MRCCCGVIGVGVGVGDSDGSGACVWGDPEYRVDAIVGHPLCVQRLEEGGET